MPDLFEIRRNLLDTHAAVEQTRRAIAEHPNRDSLLVTLESLNSRQRSLEQQFVEAADAVGLELCSYRLFGESDASPTLVALSEILGGFQSLFTKVFDAVKHGPKSHAIVSREIEQLTSMGFGYAFSGSTGLVLTIPRERQLVLFGDTDLESAEQSILDMMRAQSSADIREVSRSFGLPVVRDLNKLSTSHVKFQMNAGIEWRRGLERRSSETVQVPQFESLRNAIVETSDEHTESFVVVGILQAVDLTNRSFKLETDDRTRIHGRFTNAIDESHHAELPQRYRATVQRTRRFLVAVEEEEESYFLESLVGPISG